MKNIIAFAGSSSKKSINKQLVTYAASKVSNTNVSVLDLNDFPLPIFSIDHEMEIGIPENAQKFFDLIKSSDGVVLSLAEHNGGFASVFKNIYDWMSRIDRKLWHEKPMLLMSTSPGGGGGASVMATGKTGFPHMGGNVVADFSLPFFGKNFTKNGIVDAELNQKLDMAISTFEKAI